jgi:Phage integrase family
MKLTDRQIQHAKCPEGLNQFDLRDSQVRGLVRRNEMQHWTPHDLRRTAASKMRAMGVERVVVQAILNHKDRSVTAVYDRYGLDPEKREALTAWGRRVEQIVGGEPRARVVEFTARRGSRELEG